MVFKCNITLIAGAEVILIESSLKRNKFNNISQMKTSLVSRIFSLFEIQLDLIFEIKYSLHLRKGQKVT